LRPLFDDAARDYDAVLVVSFGGPEGCDDVLPFLDNVLRGLPISPAGKARIAERYYQFGGVSPIAEYTRDFVGALEAALAERGPRLPVYLGNRNWRPMLAETLAQMTADGIRNALVHVTSTFSSYSGCRRYREDLYEASNRLAGAPRLDRMRYGYNHPGFIAAMADRLREALARFSAAEPAPALVFTAHSLPLSMARACDYEAELRESCGLAAGAAGAPDWSLAYQSENASYGEPWLGPNVDDALRTARDADSSGVVVAPIGFVCDHLEVVLDLDVEAAQTARELGIRMERAGTVGTHPAYVEMVRNLIVERMAASPERRVLGGRGPRPDICPADCCLSGRRGDPRPALCGADSP
jgi:ferrochelatase